MSEMSLVQQIHQIENMMDYITLMCKETEYLNKCILETVEYLRQNGLRTETANNIEQVKMGTINAKLDPMLERMMKSDYIWLKELKEDLERAANR